MKKATKTKTSPLRARARAREEQPAVWLPPAKLKPWADNPRENDAAIERVAASIKRFGFGAPIVARAANLEIIAGHTRWRAAMQLKLDRVPVRLLDVSAQDAHMLAIRDNRDTELTAWSSGLRSVLKSLELDDVHFIGFSDRDLKQLEAHIVSTDQASAEVDLEKIAAERTTHKCPQCGCEFNE